MKEFQLVSDRISLWMLSANENWLYLTLNIKNITIRFDIVIIVIVQYGVLFIYLWFVGSQCFDSEMTYRGSTMIPPWKPDIVGLLSESTGLATSCCRTSECCPAEVLAQVYGTIKVF